jgi:hypothetical protein
MKHAPVLLVLLLFAFGGKSGAQTSPLFAPANTSPFDVGDASGRCCSPTSTATGVSIC